MIGFNPRSHRRREMDDRRADLSDRIEAWMARLPGLGTYRERERRRETDKLVREKLSSSLYRALTRLRELERKVSSSEDISSLTEIDRICSMLQQLADTIRFASYGYGGIFDLVKLRDEELEKLCQFDLYLLEDIESLEQRAQGLVGSATPLEDLHGHLREVEGECRKTQELFAKRKDFISRSVP
jgi:hypothetical protein